MTFTKGDVYSEESHHRPQYPPSVQYPPVETPVLIIGGGPIGLFCSILLARYGINSTIIERHPSRLGQPKAHVINPRSLEIMRQAGLDTERLRRFGVKPEDADVVRFSTSLAGLELGSIPFDKQDESAFEFTPEPLFNMPQPVLEDYLREVVIKTGKASIWSDCQWESSEMNSDGSGTSKILNRRTNTISEYRSKYLLCCDGANARSRGELQIPFSSVGGLDTMQKLSHVTIHFKADLSRMRSGTLFWIWSLSQTGTFICYDRASSWVFVFNYDPVKVPEPHALFSEEFCRKKIDKALGTKVDYEVQSITIWSSDTRVADFYRSKTRPNAFLVGDAAHAFPPSGGLGINTGFGDAQNLVWRIQAVENNWGHNSILEAYDKERRPVALANARFSNNNRAKMRSFAGIVFGPDLEDPEIRMKDPLIRKQIEKGISQQFEHFNSINLQLGYVYGDVSSSLKSYTKYSPSFVPGARLPHAWIRRNGLTLSTLDLIDGHSFVLLVTSRFKAVSKTWYPLGSQRVPVQILRLGIDFHDDGNWSRRAGIHEDRGLLIRPDQHILCSVSNSGDLQDQDLIAEYRL